MKSYGCPTEPFVLRKLYESPQVDLTLWAEEEVATRGIDGSTFQCSARTSANTGAGLIGKSPCRRRALSSADCPARGDPPQQLHLAYGASATPSRIHSQVCSRAIETCS